eukprot:NODE_5_length_72347_cov_1.339331.p19 type:complete len:397 gc:universal NODE_5_length_72347_cov_1.339331:11255-12445(+)
MIFNLLIFALEFSTQVYIYDKFNGGYSKFDPPLVEGENNLRYKRDFQPKFNFEIRCDNIDEITCSRAKSESQDLSNALSTVLNLQAAIKMLVTFTSFCATTCGNTTIARTGPTSYFALKKDQTVLYPQSLVKQIATNEISYTQYDATINFNIDGTNGQSKIYFESFEDPDPTKYSFKFILSHELMHGAGLVTSFDEYLDPSRLNTDQAHLLSPSPNPNYLTKRQEFVPKNQVLSSSPFQFVNLYDTFLVDARTNIRLKEIFRTNFFGASLPLPRSTVTAASSLYKASTTRYAIVFDTGKEQIATDTSFSEFNPGSTMSHIDPTIGVGSLDELMWSIASHERTTDLAGIDQSPLGYSQLKMLQAMGYKIKIDPSTIPRSPAASLSNILFIISVYLVN